MKKVNYDKIQIALKAIKLLGLKQKASNGTAIKGVSDILVSCKVKPIGRKCFADIMDVTVDIDYAQRVYRRFIGEEELPVISKSEKTKVCSKCGKEKSVDDFCRCNSTPDGLQRWCKECANIYNNAKRTGRVAIYQTETAEPEGYKTERITKGCHGLTKGGRPVKVIYVFHHECKYPIVAIVENNDSEHLMTYMDNGQLNEVPNDLDMDMETMVCDVNASDVSDITECMVDLKDRVKSINDTIKLFKNNLIKIMED